MTEETRCLPDDIADIWDTDIVKVRHRFAESPLFSDAALAELVAQNPDAVREIAKMDPDREDAREWRDSGLSASDPKALFDAVEGGALWVNIGHVGARDARYQALLDDLMDSVEAAVPGFSCFNRQLGILISSPNARVYYHADVPGQGLLHIRGQKRIWLYPGSEPFLKPEELERIITTAAGEEIAYDPAFDKAATVIDLTPGDGLFWPLNWPHRVVNGNSLNVSATIEYHTRTSRRHFAVNYANGLMRQVFGMTPRSRAIDGPAFWSKAAIAYACRKSGLGDRLIRASDAK
ncbi:cupin-like domain-containing protein [Stappia sp. ES.058]|uniref:cupin-like domain-containing protein n=1 Tax=Stappia sp. ES.058 TaxID=1881061 RepID=UPI00087A61E9|nr:cupin-like domain-containing protein [Stappia sp. ES.058]SDU23787.1 Cupin-like domain-containing protein [Stappia sp. ES.058]